MTDLSYIAKFARAKKHISDLERAISDFNGTHPYTVRKRVEGKKQRQRFRLEFTSSPADTPIPVIAADAINNLRFSLDHLMCALVPPKERSGIMFPIFFEGVWEAIVPGENQQRVKERARWATAVKSLSDDAVAVLKRAQPPDGTGKEALAPLRSLNGWSNEDRHRRLPIISKGLQAPIETTITRGDGTIVHADIVGRDGSALKDHTDLQIPHDTMDVKIDGAALVAIDLGIEDRFVVLPDALVKVANTIESEIFRDLAAFVRPDAA